MPFQANMVEVRAADLSGTALHWAVAVAKYGKVFVYPDGGFYPPEGSVSLNEDDLTLWVNNGLGDHTDEWLPSTNWGQGGPLIDEHVLSLRVAVEPKAGWDAVGGVKYCATAIGQDGFERMCFGETRLIAACRVVVEALLGTFVSVPAELLAFPS
ncbi:DUF2591 domain-containing protein [Pseudomonas aeruginosa]|uniref:DUF2591 domain-containing protein n=1 Tax=Ectopseudomonas TaxID=3236654 RepID=UPI00215703A4|nr:DUF2591 domain-containing protein [Pseudomonas guguanensis]MCR7873088.1 DUF2591 domain-containing protein [Pseudomonas aeruginosa]MDR8015415.1 DUF2591 domain-containing protein [Pseudomonas guguanensis]HBP4949264.1 DUF2591 domain-containing protein [Pseudomonas aeruginosa]